MQLRLCRELLAANAVCLISGRTFFTVFTCEKGAFFVNICYYVVSYKCIELEMHMKTKKYESIMNKAMKAAMNYENPDDQINEFIRFFGEHIGSERIYIFEDNIRKKVTNNTYEWCADGIEPQIEFLQNVDMSIIDWWYTSFNDGRNISTKDIEEIKDEYPAAYELLKVQNVKSLAVSPFRYKDEIYGFFGVDNPPESEMDEISRFLDMIGTFLVLLLKQRNVFKKSKREAMFSAYSALAGIYLSMHIINLKTGEFHEIKSTDFIRDNMIKGEHTFAEQINSVMKSLPSRKYVESVLEFVDISTLPERMKNKTTIVHEFLGNYSGWCRERFIRVDEDSNGELWHVVYAVEVIDAEKRKENRLLYLSETDLMTGIRNRGSGEKAITDLIKEGTKGLMCLLDCDKFKNVNDTYGHVVGDAVIIAVARSLQSVCREHDICMRLGGDEFAMFIPGITETKDAESFTMRVFAKLKDIRIPEMGDEKIYVSMGEAFYKGEKDIDFDELYRHADSAMYKSKNNTGYCATLECVTKTF